MAERRTAALGDGTGGRFGCGGGAGHHGPARKRRRHRGVRERLRREWRWRGQPDAQDRVRLVRRVGVLTGQPGVHYG